MKGFRRSKENPYWDPDNHLWDAWLYWLNWKEYRYLDRKAFKRELRAAKRQRKAKHRMVKRG